MKRQLSAAVPFLMRFCYTQNPFYLIGTLLVLYGLQQSLGQDPSLATSSLLVGLLAGYSLLLAGVATFVIRYGNVWDDARTILLVIAFMFFMLSTSLDFHLLFTLEEPWPGTLFLAGGLAFAILVSEALLRGLRIHLSAAYRGPFYLVLMLLFAYPAMLGWMNYYSKYASLGWALFAFPLVAAIALLTLLPAARTPPWKEPKSGTPWLWPYYPWSLFIFLTVGVAIRAWWLTIAFEPAKGPDAYFQPYFLLPLVLAWAVLVLEMGLMRGSRRAVAASMLLPLIGLIAGFPGAGRSPVEVAFLDRLTATIASPAQLTVWSLLAFYGWAWLRRGRAAEGFLLALGLLTAIIGPKTLDLSTLSTPQPLVLMVVAVLILVQAARFESTWRGLLGSVVMMAAARLAGGNFDGSAMLGSSLWFWQWHAPLLALLWVTAIFDDDLARVLRSLAWRATPCLAFTAVVVYPWIMPGLPQTLLVGYLAALLLVATALWLRQRQVAPLAAAVATVAAAMLANVRPLYLLLAQTVMAEGLAWLASGLAVVLLAFAVSLFKTGVWPRFWDWLARMNYRLVAAAPTSSGSG